MPNGTPFARTFPLQDREISITKLAERPAAGDPGEAGWVQSHSEENH
jgi:hypothetical protein